jgi:aryl-alcohol dehydrogenase-like predicted oxidoreductase
LLLIPGTSSVAHLRANLAAVDGLLPPAACRLPPAACRLPPAAVATLDGIAGC